MLELPDPYQKEADFQRAIVQMARICGWQVYHTADSRRSTPGFPDLVLWHPQWEQVLFRELKTEKGVASQTQKDVLLSLTAAGADARIWRPSDWELIEGTLTGERGLWQV